MSRRCDGCLNWTRLRTAGHRGRCSERADRGFGAVTSDDYGGACSVFRSRRALVRPKQPSMGDLLRRAEASMRLMADRILELEAER
jgi:hypothetical protein